MNKEEITQAISNVILANLIGRPGCGKEFTGDRLLEMNAGYGRIIMSTVIDREKARGSGIAMLMKQYKDAGKLVPDEFVIELFFNEVAALYKEGCKTIVIDGFPRTETQHDELRRRKARLVTFHLKLEPEQAVKRMLERGRPGETLELCWRRQAVFEEQTLPAIMKAETEGSDSFVVIDALLESPERAKLVHEHVLKKCLAVNA